MQRRFLHKRCFKLKERFARRLTQRKVTNVHAKNGKGTGEGERERKGAAGEDNGKGICLRDERKKTGK